MLLVACMPRGGPDPAVCVCVRPISCAVSPAFSALKKQVSAAAHAAACLLVQAAGWYARLCGWVGVFGVCVCVH